MAFKDFTRDKFAYIDPDKDLHAQSSKLFFLVPPNQQNNLIL